MFDWLGANKLIMALAIILFCPKSDACEFPCPLPSIQVSREDGSVLVLVGTLHVSNAELEGAVLEWANKCLNEFDTVIFEVASPTILPRPTSPSAPALEFIKAANEAITRFISKHPEVRSYPIDDFIEAIVRRTSRRVMGLESSSEQLSALESLSPEDLKELAKSERARNESEKGLRSLEMTYAAWLQKDMEALEKIQRDECSASASAMRLCEQMIFNRNGSMARALLRLAPPGKSVVFVGVNHILGVAAMLRQIN